MPVGVDQSGDQKEQVYNLVKRLHLLYTIIDIGQWYQASFLALPSGKIDIVVEFPNHRVSGDGNIQSALTDLRDIENYVGCIVKDERTLNTIAFAYNELWTFNHVCDLLEKLLGEQIPQAYAGAEEFEQLLVELEAKIKDKPQDPILSL